MQKDIPNKIIISFAGVPGSSKSPIAHYLSIKTGLPVFSNDVIRTEVREDLGAPNQEEYERRRDERLADIVRNGTSFIYDASTDRHWGNRKEEITKAGYRPCIISLDFSKELLESQYRIKGYDPYLRYLDQNLEEHQLFLDKYGEDVVIHILDRDFPKRLEVSLEAVNNWLNNLD